MGKGQNNNLSTRDLKKVKIKIPIISTGKFDLQKQKEIAKKYRKIEEIKRSIKAELENITVDIGS